MLLNAFLALLTIYTTHRHCSSKFGSIYGMTMVGIDNSAPRKYADIYLRNYVCANGFLGLGFVLEIRI